MDSRRRSSSSSYSNQPQMISQQFEPPQNPDLMTDQCTDQCVVITCNDPNHVDGISCNRLYSDFPSSQGFHPTLNKAPICTDSCPGESVCPGQSTSQCSPAQTLLQGPMAHGCGVDCNPVYTDECADCVPSAFFYEMCCADPYSHPSAATGDHAGYFWNQEAAGSDICPDNCLESPMSRALSHPPEQPCPLSYQSSQVTGVGCQAISTPESTSCQWGNCQASFSLPAELVGHVNVHHLGASSNDHRQGGLHSSPPPSIVPTESTSSSLSCQWRNCDKHPTPTPSRHTCQLSYEQWRDFIAVHVFKDHLGLPPDIAEARPEKKPPHKCDEETPSAQPKDAELDILSTPTLSPTLSSVTEPTEPISRISISTPLQGHNENTSEMINEPEEKPPTHHHRCVWRGCTSSFQTCEELTVHLSKVHVGSGRPIYECLWEGCTRNGDAGFGSRQKINRHLQSHTGHRPFQCKVCQQNFSEAATLQQHMRRHTREKPYVCDHPGCGKAFAIAGALTIHKRTHNGQRPFKCTHCERAFAESSNLSKHLRTHTGAKPYSCPEVGCLKSFARPDQLSRHLVSHRRRARRDQ